MAGHSALDAVIGVQIPAGQPFEPKLLTQS